MSLTFPFFILYLIENRLEFPIAPGFDGSIEECVVPVLDAHPFPIADPWEYNHWEVMRFYHYELQGVCQGSKRGRL